MKEKLYSEDNLLSLSGIQHIAFCERQWALIHIEQQWAENVRTVEGRHLHERVDNPFSFETRGDTITARAVPIVSYELGFSGITDVIEFCYIDSNESQQGILFPKGILLPKRQGYWMPIPVEYKRGKPKQDGWDEVQVCAQAMCIEEMHNIGIDYGFLYYGQIKHRQKVLFTSELRERVTELSRKMHEYFDKGITPAAVLLNRCKLCSLVDICMPKMGRKGQTVKAYVRNIVKEIEAD